MRQLSTGLRWERKINNNSYPYTIISPEIFLTPNDVDDEGSSYKLYYYGTEITTHIKLKTFLRFNKIRKKP